MANEVSKSDLNARPLTLEKLFQLFKIALSAIGLILFVFVLGALAGALGTYSMGTSACDNANKCCEKIEPVSKFVQEKQTGIESRMSTLETKLDSIDKKITDLTLRKSNKRD